MKVTLSSFNVVFAFVLASSALLATAASLPTPSAKAALIWDLAKERNTAALAQELLGASEADLSFEQLCGVPEDPSLYNPLMIAAKYGHVEATSMLIAAGIDVNHRDPENWDTALNAAVDYNQPVVVRSLHEAQADVNILNKFGLYALSCAAVDGHVDIINLLVDAHVNLDAQGKENMTALVWAASSGEVDAARALIKAGADLNLQDTGGLTALMEAVMRNHSTFAEILVQAGADLNLQDNDGKTARMHAAAEGNASVVQMLLHAGARRDLYDKDYRSASEHAHTTEVKGPTATHPSRAEPPRDECQCQCQCKCK